jgi:hypothetical protein
MKVEVNESKSEKDIEFPCLMKFEETIILATEYGCQGIEGFCLKKGKSFKEVGDFHDSWTIDFKPFKGTITLSND